MTGAAHITIQIDLADAALHRGALVTRIEQLEKHLAKPLVNETERLLTRDIIASLRRSIAAIDEQLPARSSAA